MRKLLLLMLCLLSLWFVGCGGGATPPGGGGGGGDPAQVQGNWSATLTSTSIPGSQGTVDAFIAQTGNALQASPVHAYNPGGWWCVQGVGEMTGTVNGNSVTLTVQVGNQLRLTLTGTLSNGVLTGTYTTNDSCGSGDAGNFSAQRSPSITSNLWAGTASFPGGSADFTANLTESPTGNVTGSITFSNSPCITTLNVVGDHLGSLVSMTDTNGMVIDMWGSLDVSGKTILGYQLLEGSMCGFETYTMSRP